MGIIIFIIINFFLFGLFNNYHLNEISILNLRSFIQTSVVTNFMLKHLQWLVKVQIFYAIATQFQQPNWVMKNLSFCCSFKFRTSRLHCLHSFFKKAYLLYPSHLLTLDDRINSLIINSPLRGETRILDTGMASPVHFVTDDADDFRWFFFLPYLSFWNQLKIQQSILLCIDKSISSFEYLGNKISAGSYRFEWEKRDRAPFLL